MPHTKNHPQPTPHRHPTPEIHSVAFVSLGTPKSLRRFRKGARPSRRRRHLHHPRPTKKPTPSSSTPAASSKPPKPDPSTSSAKPSNPKNAPLEAGHRQDASSSPAASSSGFKAQLLDAVPEVDALVGVFDRENIVKAVRGNQFEHLPEAGRDLRRLPRRHQLHHQARQSRHWQRLHSESDRARLRLTTPATTPTSPRL